VNLILVISDTFRRDHLGCYGNRRIHTPHLDRFAAEAVVFDQAFVGSFPTVPLRNDILTGRYTFTHKAWAPVGPEPLLQEILGRHGVLTAAIADTPHPFAPAYNYQRGFHSWLQVRGQENDRYRTAPEAIRLPSDPAKLRAQGAALKQYYRNVADRRYEEDYFPAQTVRAGVRWLEENARAGQPFFLYLDTFDPHEPWDPPAHYLRLYEDHYEGDEVVYPRYDRSDYLTEAELEHIRNLYRGEVSLVDRWVGYLLDSLDALGLRHDTAVVFTSDHGFYFGDHGYIGKSIIRDDFQQPLPLYPEVCRIPMIARVPGVAPGRSAAKVQAIDIHPTALDLLGVPDGVERGAGHSLLGPLKGEAGARTFTVSAPALSHPAIEVPHPASRATICDGDWLLVFGSQVDARRAAGHTTAMVDSVVREERQLEGDLRPELYRLADDPGCLVNRFGEGGEALRAARRLHAQFVAFLEREGMRPDHVDHYRTLPV
jgi:arylsulfatase A-like enzyme